MDRNRKSNKRSGPARGGGGGVPTRRRSGVGVRRNGGASSAAASSAAPPRDRAAFRVPESTEGGGAEAMARSESVRPPSSSSSGGGGGRRARLGDVVTADFTLTPEDGYVPHPLFDTSGTASFVLGWGNYLPGLHALVEGMRSGDSVAGVSIDAGWGRRDPKLVVRVPGGRMRAKFPSVAVGDVLTLEGGLRVTVAEVGDDDCYVVDANPPLAGSSYACSLRVLDVQSPPASFGYESPPPGEGDVESRSDDIERSRYEAATFALGCFWGGELAYLRAPGVVGTRVGYTQGRLAHPTYEQVCEGTTNHREAILVLYDPSVVTYGELVEVAMERLDSTHRSSYSSSYSLGYGLDLLDGGPGGPGSESQYRYGIYYHNDHQRREAEGILNGAEGERRRDDVEIRAATKFYWAEEYHQNYLLKGGQSARKNSRDPIRCYG